MEEKTAVENWSGTKPLMGILATDRACMILKLDQTIDFQPLIFSKKNNKDPKMNIVIS